MSRLAVMAVLIVGMGCAAPVPTPTALPSATPTKAPTASPFQVPGLEGWQRLCSDVPEPECSGVAELFVGNLGRSWVRVHEQSGGMITVTARPECPAVPDWADATYCWQARALVDDGAVCVVVARQLPEVAQGLGFGLVGGAVFGRPGPPTNWPPCV